jgi:hypothetical protein
MADFREEYEYKGVTYLVVPKDGCDGCAFDCVEPACSVAVCWPEDRQDKTGVIFIAKPSDETQTN